MLESSEPLNGIYLSPPVATPSKILKGDQEACFGRRRMTHCAANGLWPMESQVKCCALITELILDSYSLKRWERQTRNGWTVRFEQFVRCCLFAADCKLQQSVFSCHDKCCSPMFWNSVVSPTLWSGCTSWTLGWDMFMTSWKDTVGRAWHSNPSNRRPKTHQSISKLSSVIFSGCLSSSRLRFPL